jgi:hypothetical protein
MNVTYGADYSAGELSPPELESFTDYDIRFLIRYIGWPERTGGAAASAASTAVTPAMSGSAPRSQAAG